MQSIPSFLYIGMMSGTSLDGIDTVLADFSGRVPRILAAHATPYSATLRAEVLALQTRGNNELERSQRLALQLADTYVDSVNALLASTHFCATQVCALGCHGQTVRHAPQHGYSVQLNSPARIAERTGIDVIADFRSRDLAAGGQGAPLVPAFHQAVFGDDHDARVIVNIGGIANLTRLTPGQPVIGFDTGPGNMLLDAWIEHTQGVHYDRDGAWAAGGHVRPDLLARLLSDPFFAAPPPKSTGRDLFSLAWLQARLDGSETAQDIQATLIALTAHSIATAIQRNCPTTRTVFLCGGGAYNLTLFHALGAQLPHCAVHTTAEQLGVPAQEVEALAFAWLAYAFTQRIPSNLPAVTGAQGARVLGALYPR